MGFLFLIKGCMLVDGRNGMKILKNNFFFVYDKIKFEHPEIPLGLLVDDFDFLVNEIF